MTKLYFEILNNENNIIKGDLRIPVREDKTQLIIFSHGFKGFRNWSFIPYICNKFTDAGFITINHDFSCNGIEDEEKQIYNDEVFRKHKVTTEINDLRLLIENILSGSGIFSEIQSLWNQEIYLIGHSLGGAVSILTAIGLSKVTKISLWASISRLDRNTERQKAIWRDKGYAELEIASTGQKLHLDYTYILDKDESLGPDAIMKAINILEIPIQVIHPGYDLTVKMKEAHELMSSKTDNKHRELFVTEKSGHVFNCKHPFTITNPALESTFEATLKFFEN